MRALREEQGISREDVADYMQLSFEMVRKMEQGKVPPSFKNLVELSYALRVDPLFLLVNPELNPVHELIELLRGTKKAQVDQMLAACREIVGLPASKLSRQGA